VSNKNPLMETVISLGAEIDNEGVNKLLRLLDNSRLKALGVSAAFAGITTGIYKLIESATKREFELERLAKKQKKTVNLVRAENEAMRAMGKTLSEIKKDDNLNKIYKDLVEFNKQLEFPNMSNALGRIRELQSGFYKLKSMVSNATQWINAQVLANLERPIDRITGKLNKGASWLRDNMSRVSTKIATFISDFAKGLVGIAETMGNIFDLVNKLPDGIKAIAVAIGGAFAMIKGGTLGRLLALVTIFGDVMHDYDNWQSNKEKGLKPGDEGYVGVAFGEFFDIGADDSLSTREKSRKVTEKLVTKISGILQDVSDYIYQNNSLTEALSGETSIIGSIFGGIVDFFTNNPDKTGQLLSRLFTAFSNAIATGGQYASEIAGSVGNIIATAFNKEDWWKDSNLSSALNGKNGLISGIFSALELSAVGASPIVSIISGAIGGLTTEKNKVIESLYKGLMGMDDSQLDFAKKSGLKLSEMEEAIVKAGLSDQIVPGISQELQSDFNTAISGVIELLGLGFEVVGDTAGAVMKSIIHAILGDSEDGVAGTIRSALGEVGPSNPIWNGISLGLASWIASGNLLVGVAAAIGEMLATTESKEELEQAAQEIANMFMTIWDGEIINEKTGERSGIGLHSFFETLLYGADGESGLKKIFVDIGDKIVEWLTPVFALLGDALSVALYNALESAGILDVFDFLGIGIHNPNTSKLEKGENGNWILKSSNGREKELTPEQVAYLGNYMRPNKDGSPGVNKDTEFDVSIDKEDNVVMTGQFGFTRQRTMGIGENRIDFGDGTPVPGFNIENLWNLAERLAEERAEQQASMDTDEYEYVDGRWVEKGRKAEYDAFFGAGVNKATEAAKKGQEELQKEANNLTVSYPAVVTPAGENTWDRFGGNPYAGENNIVEPEAYGGRIGSAGHYLVGEDGPEYIIPITKPERAMALINRMLNEMGLGAVQSIAERFGIGSSASAGTFGSSMDSVLGGVGGTSTFNVSAPVTIYVNATGADGKEIGSAAYDAAERHLVKTLRGVYA